ncbi:MAG: DinB family protein [Capsulimonas sp.]|uniref:DinB family protein n=1 Tax=Capsulimonas sp. TaxID=2494211 RepID=UPI003263DE18
MSRLELHRQSFEHEKDSNQKMLAMIGSVPDANRGDARFQQAVTLAGHLAACRENWLDYMHSDGLQQAAWFDKSCDLATLAPRFVALEAGWTDYLARLTEDQLLSNFEFSVEGAGTYSLPTEGQIVQLFGHASYHRGQIALLVDQLGGETVDTDYIFWLVPESAD